MKRNRNLPLTLVHPLAALTFGSNAAWANHHWGDNNRMGAQGYSQADPGAAGYRAKAASTITLRKPAPCASSAAVQTLWYNALLTTQKAGQWKIEAVSSGDGRLTPEAGSAAGEV